ncbi:8215_t:CDS:2 [Scutellospora calospora]|uniref:8215_t:CDS:1 n=1 Tax=Scutellospora calospora TaxID=85575 RepID=A0ACA9KRS2_9GLOM|nr:8215_t:CDS:2 [Scutellospora calospora]
MIKKSLKQIYNNLLEHPEKNEIVKELCKLYNEERSKGKNPDQILDTLDKFLVKKKQNPDNIIIWFLNNKISSTVQTNNK